MSRETEILLAKGEMAAGIHLGECTLEKSILMDETHVADEKRPHLAAAKNVLNMSFILAHPAETSVGALLRGDFEIEVAKWGDLFTLAQGRDLGEAVKRIMDRATVFGTGGGGDEKNSAATASSPHFPPSQP